MIDESRRVSLHPNWENLSEEKKDLFCAAFRINREGIPLEDLEDGGEGLRGISDYVNERIGSTFITYKKKKEG